MKLSPVSLALAMVSGVFITSQFGLKTTGIVIMAMLLLYCIYSVIVRRLDFAIVVLISAILLSGIAYMRSVNSHKTYNYINRYVTLEGKVISVGEKSKSSDNYRYIFRVTSVTNRLGTIDTNENILLTTPEQIRCRTSLKVKGIIKELPKQMNENGFDAAKYYKSNNIFTRMYSDEITTIQPLGIISVYAWGQTIIERIDDIIFRYYKDDGAAILSAVLVGNQNHFSDEYDEILSLTGFRRMFHPAYLHIFIIYAIIGIFSKLTHKKYRDIVTGVIFFVYAILQCSNIGFSRSMICGAVAIYYRLRYGNAYKPDTIAVVVAFCMVVMPTIIFNSSFLLSITGGLLAWAFMPYTSKKMRFVPKRLRNNVAAVVIFMLLLLPINAYYYNGVCLYSYIASVVTAPVVVFILIISPITLGLRMLFGAAPIIGAYLNAAIRLMYNIPYLIRKLPFSYISIGKPSITFILMFICVIFMMYYILKSRRLKACVYASMAGGLCFALILVNAMRIGTVELSFVNVGQGDGAIIHTPFRETVVIDAGGTSEWTDYDTGKALFVPYLEAEGINHIEAIIVSHYHKDHAEGVISVLNSVKTDYVFAPELTDADSESMKDLSDRIKKTAEKTGAEFIYITDDTRLTFRDGLVIDIYSPEEYTRAADENDTSIPTRVTFGEFSALFTGDMTDDAERAFTYEGDISSDVLKVSHHGSGGSSCEEFIKAVSPKCTVISCGEGNMYNHPNEDTLKRLEGADILRTDLMGDIRISARENGEYNINK